MSVHKKEVEEQLKDFEIESFLWGRWAGGYKNSREHQDMYVCRTKKV